MRNSAPTASPTRSMLLRESSAAASALKAAGRSLQRIVDLVPSHWHNTLSLELGVSVKSRLCRASTELAAVAFEKTRGRRGFRPP